MKYDYKKIFAALICLLLLSTTAFAQSFEGKYKRVRPAQPTQSEGKIEVQEIFWYGCPHCYHFEPFIRKWLAKQPGDVVFRRLPAVLNKSWIAHARAYYTAEKLGVLDRIHSSLFDALHQDRKRIFSQEELRDFFAEQGVDPKDFTRIFDSNEVDIKVKQAFVMARRFQITGVPAVVVNGKYVTSGSMAGSFDEMLKVVDHLVDMERMEP